MYYAAVWWGMGMVKMFAMRGGDSKWFCAMCGNGDGERKKIYMRGGDGKENHLLCNALVRI